MARSAALRQCTPGGANWKLMCSFFRSACNLPGHLLSSQCVVGQCPATLMASSNFWKVVLMDVADFVANGLAKIAFELVSNYIMTYLLPCAKTIGN